MQQPYFVTRDGGMIPSYIAPLPEQHLRQTIGVCCTTTFGQPTANIVFRKAIAHSELDSIHTPPPAARRISNAFSIDAGYVTVATRVEQETQCVASPKKSLAPTNVIRRQSPPAPLHRSSARADEKRPEKEKLDANSRKREPQRMILGSLGFAQPAFKQALVQLLRARRPLHCVKVMYIPDAGIGNGWDVLDLRDSAMHEFGMLGVSNVDCVELRQTTPEALSLKLVGVDCIYVDMGNVYYLRYYMQSSGFDHLVPTLVRDAGVIFAGASAGSICAGHSIETAFWKGWDDPGYGQEWDLQHFGYVGLDLIPDGRSVFPHYGPQWTSLVDRKRSELDHEVLVLDDERVWVIDGDRERFVPSYSLPASRNFGSWSFSPPRPRSPVSPTSPVSVASPAGSDWRAHLSCTPSSPASPALGFRSASSTTFGTIRPSSFSSDGTVIS